MRRAAALLLFTPLAAQAVSPDLKVSTDDLNEAGEHFIELQANKASRAGPAAAEPRVPLQWLAEYSYGITGQWQLAVKLPFARDAGARSLGSSVEVRYLPAHDREAGAYWGVDLSLGRGRERHGSAWSSGLDVVQVFGLRTGRWHLAGNAAIGFPQTGADRRASFGMALKAGYALGGKSEAGVEYFLDAGPFRSWHPRHERTEYLFLAWDKVVGNELNIGLGRGLTEASERWIAKAVYSFQVFK